MLDRGGIAVGGGDDERCHRPQTSGGAQVGSGLDQPLHHFEIVIVGRPVQGRRAVALCGIDVGFLFQQQLDGRVIAFHRGVRNAGVAGG